ncbi:thiaminase II [Companilactobacillus sp. DQM5]|uniref:thiaminase II n=1 Tax=Companilactobacillus sp. DQM5 TaxID=3463359 RepID=UPI004058D4E8
MTKNFTEIAYNKSFEPWHNSFTHPFITELQSGRLNMDIFKYYLLQDRYYLEHFNKLYELIAQSTDNKELKDSLIANSLDLGAGELAIRNTFFKELNITSEEIKNTPITPTAYNYVSHMYRQLYTGNAIIASASMLPCEWLYQEIGEYLSDKMSPVPIYQSWIDSYSTKEVKENIIKQRNLLDRLYESVSVKDQEKMINAFVISSQMEYRFWEMSYTKEKW